MDYGAFRQPSAGYAAPVRRATAAPAASEPLSYANGKEGEFTELPVTGGVGPFHINHFVVFSAVFPLSNPQPNAAGFLQYLNSGFVTLFNSRNVAKAHWGKYKRGGADTIEFELSGSKKQEVLPFLGGLLHSDWVSLTKSDDGQSFYASTLRRGWLLLEERAGLGVTRSEAIAGFIKINQHHFLSGRRSFRVGYDVILRRFYWETAALERSSLCEFRVLDKIGAFRSSIIEIWTSFLESAAAANRLTLAGPADVPSFAANNYASEGHVAYRTGEFETAAEAVAAPWFVQLLPRHPGLLKNVF